MMHTPSLTYRISPYVHLIENRLVRDRTQHGAFHQLTGDVLELSEELRVLLAQMRFGLRVRLSEEDLDKFLGSWGPMRRLVVGEFLIEEDLDPLAAFLDWYVIRPMQSPALAYASADGSLSLARMSMAQHIFSPRKDELPPIIEESMSAPQSQIFLQADGTKTLRELFEAMGGVGVGPLEDDIFREAINLLTRKDRQLIKLAPGRENLGDPFQPFNIVPRDLYHSPPRGSQPETLETVQDFHLLGIEDAWWEFDFIEPTLNHSFRFPSEVFGGLDYGSRFCLSALRPEVFPLLGTTTRMRVLEVGGGTGTFARSFIKQALSLRSDILAGTELGYHILELSPTLMRNQRELLSEYLPLVTHFQQDATDFQLPGQKFDLIISNEVIADFPVSVVQSASTASPADGPIVAMEDERRAWKGPGAHLIEKYRLPVENAPDTFLVHSGIFQFIERAWEHLSPGGTMILTEYGTEDKYPVQAHHLNHEEFTIHFGQVLACAAQVGFNCRLLKLEEFLEADVQVSMLSGREEHLLCLRHVMERDGARVPFAAISQKEFQERFGEIAERIGLVGYRFSPLSTGFHFGPDIKEFIALILQRPA
jgi:SAM-dependent methyltransferase